MMTFRKLRQTIISGMGEPLLRRVNEARVRHCLHDRPSGGRVPRNGYGASGVCVHEKQTGDTVIGHIKPMERDGESGTDTAFESVVMGGNVPNNYVPAVENGFLLSHLRRARLEGTRSPGCAWPSATVRSTRSTRRSLGSASPPSARSVRRISRRKPSFSSLS